MKILIIGVSHKFQKPKIGTDLGPVAIRKDLLKRLVTKRVDERRIKFVGEETRFTDDAGTESVETSARQIAVSQGGLSWKNIHISEETQKRKERCNEYGDRSVEERLVCGCCCSDGGCA